MSRRFRGEYTFKVDSKGRVSIPALFRRVLEAGDPDYTEGLRPQLVLVYGDADQDYLEAYTIDEIDKLEAKIDRLPSSKLKRKLTRNITTRSHHTEVDPDGRLVLPARYRDKIGLDKEALFVGTSGTFQIWNPDTYEDYLAEEDEEDLGFDLPEGTSALDALDMVLAERDGG
ncbi:division/cell wall cluster transcriptional repressor MraZ [Pseudodonghicola flavimaris]|uniref:Transcriptional regulator MraZ n=1 Tax=Pseudodonghicola flavimaris TaxID=3050036 RepID=A0ABT7F063_9RHOB|nr:division/cell wall cluster transcriptional repressor MraZ [Pseudodonghicola flavimaris]MDK3017994.1 division/cell wall cluster transcriptional repressor MraZ [Pseudodonghicola flavimaris]